MAATSERRIPTLPRITVLTPCLNGARYIREAVESVRRQRYPNIEHLVLDAGSTDGTLAILANYPAVNIVCEPDKGLYDAMNKGIARATGEIIGFLNTDDLYANGILDEVGRAFSGDLELDIAVGKTIVFDDLGYRLGKSVVIRDHAREDGFWLPELTFGAPAINGRFFRHRVFERIGIFDQSYALSADRHFLIRAGLAALKSRSLGRLSYCYRTHGGSLTLSDENPHAISILHEHIRMALEFEHLTRNDPARRRVFAAWHAFESAKLIRLALISASFGKATASLSRLNQDNPLWPFHVTRGVALRNAVRRAERESSPFEAEHLP